MALALAHHVGKNTAELTSEQPIVFVLDTHLTFLTFLLTSHHPHNNDQKASKQTIEASNALID